MDVDRVTGRVMEAEELLGVGLSVPVDELAAEPSLLMAERYARNSIVHEAFHETHRCCLMFDNNLDIIR